jgi:hypothetical protein
MKLPTHTWLSHSNPEVWRVSNHGAGESRDSMHLDISSTSMLEFKPMTDTPIVDNGAIRTHYRLKAHEMHKDNDNSLVTVHPK